MPFAVATLLSALSALASVVVFTRMLGAEGYGFYATALAGIGLLQSGVFFWLQTGVTRFHSRAGDEGEREALVEGVHFGFGLASFAAVGGWAVVAIVTLPEAGSSWLPAGLLLLARGWLSIVQALMRVRGQNWRYALVEGVQMAGGLAIATAAMAWFGPGASVVLWGFVAAALLAIVLGRTRLPIPALPERAALGQLREVWKYGAPLVLVSFTSTLLATGDRLLIALVIEPAAVTAYAAGSALAGRTLGLVLAPLAFAWKPTVFQAFDQGGVSAARSVTADLAAWLLRLGLPVTIFVATCADALARLLVPESIGGAASAIMPQLAIAALLATFLNLYFALAFQLSRRTAWLLAVVGPAAAINILANFVLLPRFGIVASAWTSVGSHALALFLAVALGRRHFALPFPIGDLAKVTIASAALWLFLRLDFGSLAISAIGGCMLYLAVLAGLSFRSWRQPAR